MQDSDDDYYMSKMLGLKIRHCSFLIKTNEICFINTAVYLIE